MENRYLHLDNESAGAWASFGTAFGTFSDAAGSHSDFPAIIADGTAMFASVPGQSSVVVYLSDESDHTFYPVASSPQQNHAEADELFQYLLNAGLLSAALRQTQPTQLPLTEKYGNYEALIFIPLVSHSGILGIVVLCYADASFAPAPPHLELLRRAALHMTLHLENSMLRRSVESLEGVLEQRVTARTIELHKLKTEYESIIDCVHSGIVLINPATRAIEYANPAASELLGCIAEPLVGRNADEFFDGLDADISAMNFLSLLYYDKEKNIHKRTGYDFPVIQSAATVIFDKKTLLLLTFFDISERKSVELRLEKINEDLEDNVSRRTEELQEIIARLAQEIEARERTETALEEQERLFSVIFDVLNIGICIIDSTGTFSKVNNAFCFMYGFAKDELNGQPFEKIIERTQQQQTIRQIFEDFKAGNENDSTKELTIAAGTHLNVQITSTVIYRNDGQKYLVSALIDITELRQAQQNTLIALEKERQLHDIKTNFVQMVSHEFRTPLTTVLSYAQLLKNYRQHWSEEQQDKYFNNIEMGVKQLTGLLEDVLLLGEADHGRPVIAPEPTNILNLCKEIARDAELAFSDTPCRISTEFLCGDANVVIDPKVLRRVLANILSNALKYSPSDTQVQFSVECTQSMLTLRVRDHGIGIPEEYLPKLFEPFSRAPNIGVVNGTGLGMAIVKNAVELMGGTIQVASAVNEGTAVTITIPVHSVRETQ